MQRKQLVYLLAILALLVSMLPLSAAAQEVKPTDPPPAAPNSAPSRAPLGPIGGYTFTNIAPGTYADLTGDTPFVINGGGGTLDDGYSADQTIPFPFNFGGSVYTVYRVGTNGWLGFGSPTATTNYSALNGTVNNVIAFVNRDMNNVGAVYSSVTEGVAPNRIHKIQAKNFYRYNTSTMTGNAQIWLYETSNAIEIHYGAFAQTWTSGTTVQVGLRGASTGTSDVRSLSGTGSGTWINAVAGNSSTATMQLALTVTPDSGRTYRFEPVVAPNLGASSKTATPAIVRTGQNINYTLVIKNTGDIAATGATISDPIPTGASYVAGSVATVGSPAAVYNSGSNAIEWGAAPLAVGQAVTVTFQVNVTALSGAAVANTATYNAANVSAPTTKTTNTPVVGCVNDPSYTCADSLTPGGPTYNWLDATGGTLILNATTTGDDRTAAVTLPFPFTYYGATSSDILVGDNGAILFGVTTGSIGFSNTAMSSAPTNFIAPFWDDMDTDTGGTYGQVFGTAPNRIYAVEWNNRPHYSNVGSATFQVLFYEGTNQITFQYQDVDFGDVLYNNGASATVGIKGTTIQYSFNAPALSNLLAIQFTPIVPPNINVSPSSLAAAQLPNTTTQQTLTIGNTGGSPLNWQIAEENTTSFPQGPSVVDPTSAAEEANAVAAPGAPQAAPEGIAVWRAPEVVLYDNGPLVNYPGGGAGGADESRLQTTSLGMNSLGFGHQAPPTNNWVADDFTVSDAAGWTVNTATFFAYQTGSTTTSTMTNVNWILYNGDPSSGGTVVTSGSGLQTSVFANIYRTTETTVGATDRPIMATTVSMGGRFLAPGTYWLAWQTAGTLASGPWAPPITINGQAVTGNGLQSTGGTAAWAPANDSGTGTPRQGFPFILEGTVGGTPPPCSLPSDIPWLSETPTSGSVPAGGNTPVAVTFDSTGLAPGTYTGNLCVTSNDPTPGPGNGTNLVTVPVTLTVQAFAPAITLDKTVGADPTVCATTDEITLPAGGGDVTYCYEVTNTGDVTLNLHDLDDSEMGNILSGLNYALAPGASAFVTATANIAVTTVNTATWTAYNAGPINVVTATDTATVTVQAVTNPPNIFVAPLAVSSSQATNTQTQHTLTISNTGDLPLQWEIFEEPAVLAAGRPVDGAVAPVAAAQTSVAAAQDGDNEETLLEQARALAAEQNRTAVAPLPAAPPSRAPETTTHPLFVGVDDTTVPAYQVNVATNGFQQAFNGFQVWGSAYDPVNDKVYFNNGSTLYQWPVGGSVSTVGTIVNATGASQSMVGLAFYNGQLYGVKNIANEAIWAIDTTTLVATVHIDYTDADFDLGGFSADPNTGEFYATNDDTTPNGSGLFRINPDGTGTLIAPYPAGQTDIDGLAVSDDGFAYLVTDEPGFIYVWDFTAGAYATPLNNPWTTSEIFSAGAWISQPQAQACSNPADVPWLITSPISGTTPAGGGADVTVTLDSTGLAPATYNANLCITSNDPDAGPGNETELVIVPVTLTVTAPTAVTLSGLAAAGETAPAQAPLAGVPLAALPAVVSLALGAAYVLRRKE